jgi:hypothetical protein
VLPVVDHHAPRCSLRQAIAVKELSGNLPASSLDHKPEPVWYLPIEPFGYGLAGSTTLVQKQHDREGLVVESFRQPIRTRIAPSHVPEFHVVRFINNPKLISKLLDISKQLHHSAEQQEDQKGQHGDEHRNYRDHWRISIAVRRSLRARRNARNAPGARIIAMVIVMEAIRITVLSKDRAPGAAVTMSRPPQSQSGRAMSWALPR